ncbi:MAG TPA: PIN domain-containing protein [Gammaproteobacteria bacterium]|nr:PIN domain-containing protein [Gammaproteobacteria bacterium]
MRIYLDCCCIQRPFDDQKQPRIKVEAEAVLAILAAVQAGDVSLLNSDALEYEVKRIPNDERRNEALAILALGDERLVITEQVENLAQQFEQQGVAPMDAVHVALASSNQADYFATCDDRLMRKCGNIALPGCKPMSILDLVREILK